MPFVFITAFLFMSVLCPAQRIIDVNKENVNVNNFFYTVGGEPVGHTKFVSLVEGTPYFKDGWLKSSIVLQNGSSFKDISAKLDLMEKKIHYLDPKGNQLITTSPIKEIVLYDEKEDSLFRFVNATTLSAAAKNGWYLWLLSGKASLYEVFEKQLVEEKPYGSATTEQRIKTKKSYVVFYNNALLGFSKAKQIPSILANKKSELEAFMQKQNKDLSEQDRIIAVITYYNSML
jgi:hypothetical protein